MAQEQSSKDVLEKTLRFVIRSSTSNATEKMRAALALAVLESKGIPLEMDFARRVINGDGEILKHPRDARPL